MIFVTVGTQKFLFDRLLKDIDELLEENVIKDEVVCQAGYSNYVPKNYQIIKFLNNQEYEDIIAKCDFMITHGGVGSILHGLNRSKKIIAYPRVKLYGEHVDDHQLEIVAKYTELGYILSCNDKTSLTECLQNIESFESCYKQPVQVDNPIQDYLLEYLKTNNKI